jgi:hypothetical protein
MVTGHKKHDDGGADAGGNDEIDAGGLELSLTEIAVGPLGLPVVVFRMGEQHIVALQQAREHADKT